MKKILIFLLLFLFLFTVSCSWLKKDLTLEPRISVQEKRIKELERKLEIQAQELEQIKEFIQLMKVRQDELFKLSKKIIRPYIPDSVTFCGKKVPLDRLGVRERLERALMREVDRLGMVLIFLRSGRWFPMIEKKIKERNLPKDLRYVAAVESALNPMASSDAGALGLWQFIKSTAVNIMRMTVNSYIDERYDPEKSTDDALKHLKDLYQEFGDWPSALAGYNMHKDRYKKAKAQERAQDFYEVTDIPDQTQEYVFRAIAVKLIMENPEKYGYPLLEEIDKIKYEPYFIEAVIITVNQRREKIVDIAQRLGMTYQEFRTFNPHIRVGKNRRDEVTRDWLPRGKYKVYVKTKKDPLRRPFLILNLKLRLVFFLLWPIL